MRLGVLLALVATGLALDCNVGNVVVEDGIIISKSIKSQPCAGMCSRVVLSTGKKDFLMLSCQENELSIWRYQAEKNAECSATELGSTCLCSESHCSDWEAEENLAPVPEVLDATTTPKCYVGYFSNNGVTTTINNGATTLCAAGQACAFISGVMGNTKIEAYLCTTTNVCKAAISTTNGNGTIAGDNVQMTCCDKDDCTSIVTNHDITVPQTVTQGNNNITCQQGAQLDYGNLGNFLPLPCSGSCSSVSVKTYMGSGRNKQVRLLDLYTCDPVAVCDAVNLNNACGNLVLNATNSLLRGCCCNTNNCIDPTKQPPVFPTKQLKCYTGIYVPSTGYTVGAEVVCSGKCGRIDVPVGDVNNQTIVKYMSCFPYSICQGLGIGDGDQSYNPPMEEETTVTCCSSKDNCNISPYDLSQISFNVSVIPTTNYPILCYGNIHLNGVPMTTGSYSMCNGECAMASFSTVVYGQQHNTTIYTCDPATMCKAAGITNGCTTINGTGVTTCCCDDDTCFDPNRVARTSTNCYTGIYIKEDNYLNGGETLCDGWCASLSTIVNNKNATTYWCAPVRVCRSLALGMGGDQNCQTIPNANTPLTGCCCAEGNNCNLPTNLLPNVTSTPVRREPPIICYEAIHINGVAQGNPGYRVCNGNCVSMTMGAKLNGSAQSTTLYTCDSSASCNAMGLRNGCGSVDGTVYSCCCDSDACIDPNFNRSPDRNLNCYVGVNSPMVFAGTMVQCNGKCANITTNIGNTPFSTYHCVPNSFCSAVALDNACDVLQLDRALTGCCCDSSDGCNALGTNLTTAIPVSPPEAPIACYSGLHINHQNWTAGSGWSTCMGDCMVLSINSSFNGQYMTASMYTCDPTTICTSLNMTNRCHQLEPGVEGCCCSDSACIDPTKNPPKFPRGRPLTCYNGVVSGYNNLSAGAEQSCDGSCASLSSMVNGVNFTVFSCVPKQICSQLSLYDNCQTIQADRAITGCCCDNADNCNIFGYHVPPPAPREHDFPIVCFQGIYLNNKGISIAGWQTCMGDCALVSFNTTVNGANMQADWYTCDPAAVCHQLNVVNRCQQVEPGISGCCCETDACLDPTRTPAKKPGPPLKCYVGVKSVRGLETNIDVGAETFCDGMCGNIHGPVGTYNVSTYFCAPMNLCKSLELNNNQRQLPGDRAITAYCCDLGDNCNVRDRAINTTRPVSPPEYPVSCYSGVFVNGMRVSDGGWMSCNGDCALLSMNSTFANGTSVTAELYTCDPTSVCRGLNLTNSCATVEDGLMGCCCDSNGCLDPTRMPPKRPGQLYCYAGIQSDMANVSTGAAVACNGKCGSLNGNLAGYNVSIFACVDSAVCRGLNLYDDCTNIPGDREVRACCCDNYSYCNTRRHNITSIPTPNPNTEFPISCWNGLRLNGQDISPGRWQVCNGDCASIQMNTTINGTSHSLSLYACDPTSVCTALKTRNSCNTIEPGLYGCCCDTDGCINPMKNKSPDNPLTCFVGVQSNYSPAFAAGIGATVYCSGRCASLQGQVGGFNTTTFHCVDTSICKYLQLDNACSSLSSGDREVQACCCDNGPTCNVVQAGVSISTPNVQNSTEPYIACYSGIWLNGKKITPGSYQACQGDCASVEINTVLNGNNHTATLYTCDPATVCRSLNTTNNCGILEPGLKGCCCDSDACIDPTNNRSPDRSVYCYVGVYNGALNNSIGDQVLCDGGRRCMSLATKVNGNMMKAYACVAQTICAGLGIDGTCTTTPNDQAVTACCCDKSNMCNVGTEVVGTNIPKLNFTGNPIACWSGLYVNGIATGNAGWSNCKGDCAAIQLTTTALGMNNTATLYTCDPATVCKQLNIDNTCGTLDQIPGLTGCCCSSDACLDANSIVPKSQQMTCYAGVVTSYSNNPGGIMAGAPVKCNGRCASLASTVSGYNVTIYQCISTNVCQMLGIDGSCSTIYQDRAITGCCCSNSDYCNIQGTGIAPPRFMNYTEPVIACYNGLWLNNAPIADGGYTGCNGKCSSISLNTTVNGTAQTATLYTCDPATVCSQLNLTNTCGSPEPGITGCCCDSDACIDPNYNRYPGRGLTCYVGVWNGATKQSMGVDSMCDGKCASIYTYVNNQKYKAYFCLNQKQAESLNVDNGCRRIPADREVEACVCDDTNNCNVKPDENVLQNPLNTSYSGNPIACWNGLYVNGNAQGSVGWNGCKGMCASAQWQTSLNGTNHTLTFYTCDPAAACSAMGLVNSCGQVDAIPGLTGCCCSSDACMDATSIYPKNQNLNCYAGIVTPWSSAPGGIMAGASVKCSGRCASLSSTLNGYNFTAYQCISTSICQTLGIDGTSATLTADRDITGYCCSTGDYCNIAGTNITAPKPPTYTEPPISCYSGLWVNGNATAVGGYIGCQGKCASISLTTTLMGAAQTATLYTCDPATVCSQLNLTNTCGSPEPGITGCCCDSDACIDPNYNRYPGRGLTCYVGVWNGATKQSMGVDSMCDGKCASIYTYVNNQKYKAYFCLNQKQAESLNVDNGCRRIPADREVEACVCDDTNNCNVKPDENVLQNPLNTSYSGNPIACWNGLYINGNAQGSVGWNGCKGMCASAQWQTSLNGTNHTLTFYTCDPAAACSAMGLVNSCGQVDAIPGLTGCCCSSDACMDATSIYPKNQNLNCYAGIVTPWSTAPGGIMAGASVKCSGRCASLSSTLNGNSFTAYQCISTNICQTLGIDGTSATLTADRDITGYCCSTGDYCNIAGTNITAPKPPTYTEPPISCYSGLWVNGNATAVGGYIGCQGKCASISLTTTLMGAAQTATLYTCDPATVCSQLNLTNTCGSPEPGVRGCCCDSDACIDPNYNRSPDRTLRCYVGAWNAATNGSYGDYTTCNGKCASISTTQNQTLYKMYFCLSAQQTESLGVDNGCRTVPSDSSINACACDNADNCNIMPGEFPASNAINVTYDAPPITCWSGAYVNGQKQGSVGWVGCTGNCASIQFNTTFQGNNNTLVLYTCDPAAACKALGLNNQCNKVDAIPGLLGCCCDQNACMTSDSIYPKVDNNNGTKTGDSSSVLPTALVIVFTAVYTLLRQD